MLAVKEVCGDDKEEMKRGEKEEEARDNCQECRKYPPPHPSFLLLPSISPPLLVLRSTHTQFPSEPFPDRHTHTGLVEGEGWFVRGKEEGWLGEIGRRRRNCLEIAPSSPFLACQVEEQQEQ